MLSWSNMWRIAWTFVAPVSLLGGCSNIERRLSTTAPPYVTLPNGRDPMNPERYSALGQRITKGLIATLEGELGRPLNILQISGGGQKGAFGAGVLVGWSESGTRPKFDIVTGISAGALLSTFAFLGEPEDDAVMAEMFTTINKDELSRKGGFLRFMFGGTSTMDSEPLAEMLRKYITQQTLDRIAAEARKGRLLCVGLLNLDYRQLWVVDLTALAASGEADALDTYRKVLQAAASPPLLLPPVEIKGFLFGDGGTRDRLLVVGLTGPREDLSLPASAGGGEIYVIFNDKSQPQAQAVTPDLKGIISSNLQSMLNAQMETTLLRAYGIAQAHDYRFKLMKIPDSFPLGPDSLAFDPGVMRALFEKGRTLGRGPNTWLTTPPTGQNGSAWIIKMLSELRG